MQSIILLPEIIKQSVFSSYVIMNFKVNPMVKSSKIYRIE